MKTKREYLTVKTKIENNFKGMVISAIRESEVKYMMEYMVSGSVLESLMDEKNIEVKLIHLREEVRGELLKKGEDEYGNKMLEAKWLSENGRALLKYYINVDGSKKDVNFFLENKVHVGGREEMKIEFVYNDYFLLDREGNAAKPAKRMEAIVRIFEDVARNINYNIVDATTEMRLISKWKSQDNEIQRMLILDEYDLVIRQAGIKDVKFNNDDVILTMSNGLELKNSLKDFKSSLKKLKK